MNKQIEVLKKTREYILQLIDDLSTGQLNEIPPGFNNNIIWHVGHLLVSQQGVCYARAGLPMIIPEEYYLRYKPDTKPQGFISNEEIERISALFLDTIDQLDYDYQSGIFGNYKPWVTRYGVPLSNIDDAIEFLLFHEGLHTGTILSIKKFAKRMVASRYNTL